MLRLMAPAGRDHIPNRVLQPLILLLTCWAGWSHTPFSISGNRITIFLIIWHYPCEDLIVTGLLYQVAGLFTTEESTMKEIIAREKTSLSLEELEIRQKVSGALYRIVSNLRM